MVNIKPKVHDTSASELVKQYQKTNFKVLSKKYFLLFLLISASIYPQQKGLVADMRKRQSNRILISA
jgi:hypothetical protein